MTMIQLEDVGGNIGNYFCIVGTLSSDTNMYN